jgi:quercetin dioxygenase-like cupin family protein
MWLEIFPDKITFGTDAFSYNQSSEMKTQLSSKRPVGVKANGKSKPARPAAAQRGASQRASVKAEFQHVLWHTIPLEELNPLLQRQFLVGQNVILARVLLKKGCVVPEHSHHNEQLAYVLDGALKFCIGGREIVVRTGEVLCIPPHMPHKAEALEDTVDLDVFTPPRADWIDGDDRYLQGGK